MFCFLFLRAVIIEAYEKYSEMMHWEITPMVWGWLYEDEGKGSIRF